MIEMKPCPFCGRAPELRALTEYPGNWFVTCGSCDIVPDQSWCRPEAEAIAAWNTRQNISDVLIEALEEVAAVNVCPPRDLNEAFAQREALRDVARAAIAKARGQ